MKKALSPTHRPRWTYVTRAIAAVLALSTLAVPAIHADVVFTRSTTTGEGWAHYSATFTATFTGAHTLAFTQTAGGPSGDNSILIDNVRVTNGATTIFADGFETPAIATNASVSSLGGTATIGNWICTYSAGILDGSPPNWGLSGQGLGTADGTTQYGYLQAAGGRLSSMKTAATFQLTAGTTYTVTFYQASRRDFGGTTTYTVSFDFVPPTVYASGISTVIAYDPIFPSSPVIPDSAESKPTPSVGYNDSRWVNPHPATSFPIGSHPWESTPNYDFEANWINAWGNLNSSGHGFPGSGSWGRWIGWWSYTNTIYQSWTKYTTTIYGSGTFVLQFLADNASWIYINGQMVGYQDYNWSTNGTGRYTIQLNGNGPHELGFVIWDGGGLAGGKFRIETAQSFADNNPGEALPPPPPADTTAPVISAPANITTEATGPSGAAVSFSASATDNKDGAVAVVAVPASGSTFPLGTTAVGLAASDAAGNTASATFDITVRDTTPPAIGIATNVGPVEATGAAGAAVTFAIPGATDIVDGSTAVSASPASGSTFAIGASTVTLSSSDSRGNASSRSFQVTVGDTTAPVISAPADIVAEATSAAGAVVSYSASASDLVDGSVAVSGSPASGSVFPLGATSVALSASDSRGNSSSASFSVTVVDTTAPALTVPASQTIEATSAAGAVANFAASATDAVGVTSLTYSAASGSTFAIGTTSVTVSASDAAGNVSSGSFTVTVVDTTAPDLSVPANQVLEATSAAGAVANFAASATDAVGVTSLTYSAASGSTFAIGTTTVTVSASDAAGNVSSGSFTVTVVDTTAPDLSVPANQVLEATSAAGAVANFAASATDAVGVTSLTYSAASGSTFAIGTTTVTVSASDAAGNVSSGSFTVTVVDTTAPVLTVPANQVLEATSAAGAVANFAASATDIVGVTSLTSSAASGSTFAIGTTTVTVTAKDAAGNTTSGSFTVTVVDTTAPVITAVAPSIREIWPPNKKMVPVSVTVASSDAVGVASTRIVSVTTNQPDRRTQWQITGPLTVNLLADREGDKQSRIYTITIEVRDAAGNVSTVTTTVIVPHDQRHKKDDDKDDDKKDSDKKDSDKKDSDKKDSDKKGKKS